MFISTNPSTNDAIFSKSFLSDTELNTKLTDSAMAYCHWKNESLIFRIAKISKLINMLESNLDFYSDLVTHEMGKPKEQSKSEILKCVELCIHFQLNAEKYLASKFVNLSSSESRIIYQPLGVVLGVMPWNFPFWQVFRFAIPTILAGNTVLVKPAPNVGLCAESIQNIFNEAGLGAVYSTLFISVNQITDLIKNPKIVGVSFTGSTASGKIIAKQAAENLKPQVLELGGNDVFIVDKELNIKDVIKQAIHARLQNNGQSCIAAKRFLIHTAVYDSFKLELVTQLSNLKIGNPAYSSTNVGPLAREDLKEQYNSQLSAGKKTGAKLIFSLEHKQQKGFFVNLEVLEIEDTSNILFQEEIFGPCFVLKSVENFEESVLIANDSIYGLSASVWTQSIDNKNFAIQNIESGAIFINSLSKSNCGLPFGGIKNSGYGKELGEEGIKAFVNIKTVIVNEPAV